MTCTVACISYAGVARLLASRHPPLCWCWFFLPGSTGERLTFRACLFQGDARRRAVVGLGMLLDHWFPVAVGVINDSGVWLIVVVGAGCQDDGFALSGVSSNRVQTPGVEGSRDRMPQ